MASDIFGREAAKNPHLVTPGKGGVPGEVADVRKDVEAAMARLEGAIDLGYAATAELVVSANPTDTETVTIGTNVYEFDNNAAVTAGRTTVTLGASAELTLDALVAAIAASGTALVKAEKKGTTRLRVSSASTANGTITPGPGPSIALAETMAAAANVWNTANLNEYGAGLRGPTCHGKIVCTALNTAAAASPIAVALPFTPIGLVWNAYKADGTIKATGATGNISGSEVVFDLDAAVTALADTDEIHWYAWGAGVAAGS